MGGEWNGLAPFDRTAEPIMRYLVERGFIDADGEFVVRRAEGEAEVWPPVNYGDDGGVHRPAAVHRAVWAVRVP